MKLRYIFACVLLIWAAAAAARGAAPDPSKTTVSLDLKQTPLRQALGTMFDQLGLEYSIAANVTDVPITLKAREMPFETALRAVLRLANSSGVPATYTKVGNLYQVELRHPEVLPPTGGGFPPLGGSPPPGQTEIQAEKVPLNFLRPSDAAAYLTQQPLSPGIVSIQPLARDNSLVVRGDPDAIQNLKRWLLLADVPSRPLTISVGISGPGIKGTPLAIRSAARSLVGNDITLAEQAVIGGQPAHLKVALRTQLLGDANLQVSSDWDLSVPVAAGPRGPIRLVKQLSTTTLLRPGEKAPIAEVDLSGWGGKGVLTLWMRGEWGNAGSAQYGTMLPVSGRAPSSHGLSPRREGRNSRRAPAQ